MRISVFFYFSTLSPCVSIDVMLIFCPIFALCDGETLLCSGANPSSCSGGTDIFARLATRTAKLFSRDGNPKNDGNWGRGNLHVGYKDLIGFCRMVCCLDGSCCTSEDDTEQYLKTPICLQDSISLFPKWGRFLTRATEADPAYVQFPLKIARYRRAGAHSHLLNYSAFLPCKPWNVAG